MSFCPLCGKGHGNGGDVCAKCEAREARVEALTIDARKQFSEAFRKWIECDGCTRYKLTAPNESGENLCEECFENDYIEQEM